MVSEESIELDALFEVFCCFNASDLFQEIKVTIHIHTGSDQSVPVDTLKLDVRIILLELEVNSLVEIDVWALNGVQVLS